MNRYEWAVIIGKLIECPHTSVKISVRDCMYLRNELKSTNIQSSIWLWALGRSPDETMCLSICGGKMFNLPEDFARTLPNKVMTVDEILNEYYESDMISESQYDIKTELI